MHVIKLQTHDHSNACRYRQSGQRARPAVSQTHPTQVRLLETLSGVACYKAHLPPPPDHVENPSLLCATCYTCF